MKDLSILEMARQAGSPEALRELAFINGAELSDEQAKEYFGRLHRSGELADEELDSVAGGGCKNDDLPTDGDRVAILRHRKTDDGSVHVGHSGVYCQERVSITGTTFSVRCDCGKTVFLHAARDAKKL